ncbi:proline-rich proteoglycan 2-like [Hylaeus volcanicus]|uniref:proline-rich proteoglycan 2-like n=1 Tax=Hylaeus volcanicus TaxID=313075 RepID=UPI0023B8571E|nr:proline-rich proteoglycan 2-like [Hylaeus volcanicus]
MSLNPLLGKNAAYNSEIVPLPLPNEIFLMRRTNVSICLSKATGSQALKGKGSIFLLSFRLVFVRSGDPRNHKDFNSIELPLALITHEHDPTKLPELRQPVFGCTQLIGRIYPNSQSQYPLRDDVVWTLYFEKSCESFCGAFFHVIKKVKSFPGPPRITGSPVNSNELLAFANPSDPSEIYMTQPILEQQSNFNDTTIYQEYNLDPDHSRHNFHHTHPAENALNNTYSVENQPRVFSAPQNASSGHVDGRHENHPQGASGYPSEGTPGYPPQGVLGYHLQRAPEYPSQAAPAYPSQGAPAYPSQGAPGYPSQGAPGYPSQGAPGYFPQGAPGYPPHGASGYPSEGTPGYSPQGVSGYHPQGAPGYPSQEAPGYPQQGAHAYSPQGVPGYPFQGPPGYFFQGPPGYPPHGVPGYPPHGVPGYPPQRVPGYPPQGVPVYPVPGAPVYHPR